MPRIVPLHWRKVEKAILHFGGKCVGQEGSHRKYWKQGLTRPIIVPIHCKKDIPKFIIGQIIRTLGLTIEEFYRHT